MWIWSRIYWGSAWVSWFFVSVGFSKDRRAAGTGFSAILGSKRPAGERRHIAGEIRIPKNGHSRASRPRSGEKARATDSSPAVIRTTIWLEDTSFLAGTECRQNSLHMGDPFCEPQGSNSVVDMGKSTLAVIAKANEKLAAL